MTERQYARLTLVAAVTAALLFGAQAALAWGQFARTDADARREVEQAGMACTPAAPPAPPACTLEEFEAAQSARAVLVAPRVQAAHDARTQALWLTVLAPLAIGLLSLALRWALSVQPSHVNA